MFGQYQNIIIEVSYLLAAVFFIMGLKGLGHPRTAVRGNFFGAVGMFIAIVATLLNNDVMTNNTDIIALLIAGAAVGALIGAVLSIKIKMTSMPELVAIFNGFGGLASVLVAAGVLYSLQPVDLNNYQMTISTGISGLIGSVTFLGSLVAFGKLYGLRIVPDAAVRYPGEQVVKVLLLAGAIFLTVMIVKEPHNMQWYWIMAGVGSLLGILLVIAIGGADMPVVIALMNSYSGIAAAATGFVLSNS
ncbi:MAG: NAD(P)(+) transhydrogenase (Re/Si-specific) subunit beta, partial [Spirochaetota bacterium]|nr:NAD(P)(+) transhydrogenase (Re/Si-specific) subunit beta [Spirochaetota bacterium]